MQKTIINISTTLYGMKCSFEPLEIAVTHSQQLAFAEFVKLPKDEQQKRLLSVLTSV